MHVHIKPATRPQNRHFLAFINLLPSFLLQLLLLSDVVLYRKPYNL